MKTLIFISSYTTTHLTFATPQSEKHEGAPTQGEDAAYSCCGHWVGTVQSKTKRLKKSLGFSGWFGDSGASEVAVLTTKPALGQTAGRGESHNTKIMNSSQSFWKNERTTATMFHFLNAKRQRLCLPTGPAPHPVSMRKSTGRLSPSSPLLTSKLHEENNLDAIHKK